MKVAVFATVFCIAAVAVAARVPKLYAAAEPCDPAKCKLPACKCSDTEAPIQGKIPQLVTLSFDDSVGKLAFDTHYKPLLFKRKNKDGCPISGTFFVPHEYTDYTVVNELYNNGFQIGSHSVTKNYLSEYWKNASAATIVKEMAGQKTILSKFANIPVESIHGARIPNFQLNGDKTYNGLKDAKFLYDNSWPTFSYQQYFPYTLDYESEQPCLLGNCPSSSIPGLWVVPIGNWVSQSGDQCNKLLACDVHGSKDEIVTWLKENFQRTYSDNRAPFSLLVNAAWFTYTKNSYEALSEFLDYLTSLNDVFLVSEKQVIDWMKKPVTADKYKSCEPDHAAAKCKPVNCKLVNKEGLDRYMGSCIPCPKKYPDLENPLGKM